MALSYLDYATDRKIDKNSKSYLKKIVPLADEFFADREITKDTFRAFKEYCVSDLAMNFNTVKQAVAALRKYYEWRKEKEGNNTMENITGENNISEDNTSDNKTRAKPTMKKVSLNIDKKKYLQLQCIALKHEMTFSELCNIALARILQEYQSELENITGIF